MPRIAPGAVALWVAAVSGAPAEAGVFNPTTFTLDNGLQVVAVENARAPIVVHTLWYKVGAADEPPGKSGVAHFLEHLMFKGTPTVPSGRFSKIVAANGGTDNAFTSQDYTAYVQRVASDKLELVMRMEADRMTNLRLTDEKAEPELGVVQEERRQRTANSPSAQLYERRRAVTYLRHPYRIPVIGWKSEIDGLTAEDALAFYRRHYAPNNAILIVAGDATADEVRRLAEKYYGAIPRRPVPRRVRPQEPDQLAAKRITMKSPLVHVPSVSITWRAPSYAAGETRHAYPLLLLSDILGGGSTSRLHRRLAIEEKAASGAGAGYLGTALDMGEFSVSALLDEGAGDLDSQGFQTALDDIAASIGFDAGVERFHGTLRTLSEHRARAFALLRKALTAPRFDAEPGERIRRQIVAGIEGGKDDPRRIAGRTWSRLAFGDHPYARPLAGTRRDVTAIAVEDMRRFVRERLVRDGLIVGVAGDISARELADRLDDVFGALPASAAPPDIPDPPPVQGGIHIVRKPIRQSVVVFGQPGPRRDDPDYYAAYLMNHLLGGGRTSRLNEEIREKRGLVYSVGTYLRLFDRAGMIVGQLATANARVETALDLLRNEWTRMARDGVGEDELAAAKRYINGSFPLRLDSTRSIARMLVGIQLNELGIDYIDRRPALIDAVTAADVRRVARRLLSPEKLAIVAVGDPEGLETTR